MRIPRENRQAPYLNRRDQYRMLAMVGLLCLVMIAMKFAAKPSSWHWLLLPEGSPTSEESVLLDELDFRVQSPGGDPLRPGEFRATADADEDINAKVSNDVDTTDDADAVSPSVEIPPEVLIGIEDNTLGVRRVEADAYHLMLDRVRKLPDEAIFANARDDVAFTVIMLQPEDYRGQLVTITGHLRRLTEAPVIDNDLEIDQLYDGWVFTNDSGTNPWRFVCTELPDGAPIGGELEPVKVEVTGYFFKRMGYASRGGQHVAPTLLAKSIGILPAPVSVAPQMQSEMRNWLLGFVALVIVALAAFVWHFVAADRRFAGSPVSQLAAARLDADPVDLEALKDIDVTDPAAEFTVHGERRESPLS